MTVRASASRNRDFIRLLPLEHAALVRGTDSLEGSINRAGINSAVELAPDKWNAGGTITIDDAVVVRGRAPSTEIESLVGSTTALIHITASNVVIDGLKLKGPTSQAYGIHVAASDVTIKNCVFEGFTNPIYVRSADRVMVKNCRIAGQAGIGIHYYDSDDGNICCNNIEDVSANEIQVDNASKMNVISSNACGSGGDVYINNTSSAGNVHAANAATVTVVT